MKFHRLVIISSILLLTVFFTDLHAQEDEKQNVLSGGAYEKEHVQNKEPISYQFLREADVMWSKTVWRIIDLREKKNLPMYYPTYEYIGQRRSLINVLLDAILSPDSLRTPLADTTMDVTAYRADDPYLEFGEQIPMERLRKLMGAEEKVQMVKDVSTGKMKKQKVVPDIQEKARQVKQYMVKELWFFDKQRSVMEVRLIGLCPIRWFYKQGSDIPTKQKLFWVYYPEVRKILANAPAYSPHSDAVELSMDDIFQKRFFSSFIVKESNTYNNRGIDAYASGVETLYEAKRIKNKIFNFEQELWSY